MTNLAVKYCTKCETEYPATQEFFYSRKGGKLKLQSHCKDCVKEGMLKYDRPKQDPVYARNRALKIKYNLTPDAYNALLEIQGNCCAICKDGDKRLVVDHCHVSGKVRGLLCHQCNVALGMFKDNKTTIKTALEYLP